jgi:putative membrane protein
MMVDTGWTWVFGALIVAGLVLLGIVVARVVRGGLTGSQPPTAPGSPSAAEQLAQRYARREIDTAEYEERLRHLRGA